MQSKISSILTLLLSIVTGLTIFVALFFYFIPNGSTQSSLAQLAGNITDPSNQQQVDLPVLPVEQVEQTEGKASFGLPVNIRIPAIIVDSVVEYVGLISDGMMDSPRGPDNVAWFELGPRPGENGSAVIVGHYGMRKNGKISVFNNLNKLQKGDKLYVKDDKGTIISFVVRESRSYDPNADASNVFSSNDGLAHLNLITCEGVWNKTSRSYSERLVVFTDKE